jgi:hypothetical protein
MCAGSPAAGGDNLLELEASNARVVPLMSQEEAEETLLAGALECPAQ